MERKRSDEGRRTRRPSGAAVMRHDLTEALTRAFFVEWARVGYADLSLERVARMAGAGKAAVYRRWPDKATMAGDLLSRVGLKLTDTGDAGSLEADLLAALLAIRRVLRHRVIRRVVVDIHAELERNPALAAAVRPFQQARRARVGGLIDRAVSRGELPSDVDRELAADLLGAPIYWRMVVLGGNAGRTYVETLARVTAVALRQAVERPLKYFQPTVVS